MCVCLKILFFLSFSFPKFFSKNQKTHLLFCSFSNVFPSSSFFLSSCYVDELEKKVMEKSLEKRKKKNDVIFFEKTKIWKRFFWVTWYKYNNTTKKQKQSRSKFKIFQKKQTTIFFSFFFLSRYLLQFFFLSDFCFIQKQFSPLQNDWRFIKKQNNFGTFIFFLSFFL